MDSIEKFIISKPYSKNTRDRYNRILRELIKLPDLEHLTAWDLLKFIERPNWGNNQQYLFVVACRQYLKYTYGENHPATNVKLKRRRTKPQRTLTPQVTIDLLSHFKTSSVKGKRDLAIAALAIDTGLRLNELCTLKRVDYHPAELTLAVIIKGGEWDTACYSQQTAMFIDDWLQVKPVGSDTLFCNSRSGQPLTREGLQSIVKQWGRDLGIKLSPHDLRRTFATLATRNGAPTKIVQRAGRWSNLEMVLLYTRQLEQEAIKPYLPIQNLLNN
jgi:integrase